jgi:hypothetical protein
LGDSWVGKKHFRHLWYRISCFFLSDITYSECCRQNKWTVNILLRCVVFWWYISNLKMKIKFTWYRW